MGTLMMIMRTFRRKTFLASDKWIPLPKELLAAQIYLL